MGFFSSIGSILKPVTSIVGGILGNDSQKQANAANYNFANSQFQFQKDYIQNQLQWKVADAQKAGLHPMAALGIQSPGFSPVSMSQAPLDYSWVGELGQSANYAATKAKTTPEQGRMLDLQIRGLELDNEYKQAQIDHMKADTLASSIVSNQAFDSPSAPVVNAKSPHNVTNRPNADGGYVGPTVPLLTLARSGNTLLDVINPDIADSVTESAYRNAIAAITPEYSVAQGYLKPPIEYLTKSEIARVKNGELELARFPGGWNLKETMRHKVSKIPKSDLDKRFFNWVDGFFK